MSSGNRAATPCHLLTKAPLTLQTKRQQESAKQDPPLLRAMPANLGDAQRQVRRVRCRQVPECCIRQMARKKETTCGPDIRQHKDGRDRNVTRRRAAPEQATAHRLGAHWKPDKRPTGWSQGQEEKKGAEGHVPAHVCAHCCGTPGPRTELGHKSSFGPHPSFCLRR